MGKLVFHSGKLQEKDKNIENNEMKSLEQSRDSLYILEERAQQEDWSH